MPNTAVVDVVVLPHFGANSFSINFLPNWCGGMLCAQAARARKYIRKIGHANAVMQNEYHRKWAAYGAQSVI